jgi:hypothetical protein
VVHQAGRWPQSIPIHPAPLRTTPTSPIDKIKARAKDTKEIRITLAIEAVNNQPSPLSIRCAAAKYGFPRTTLQTQLQGVRSRSESQAEKQTLTPDEERAIVRWIERLGDMAIPPRVVHVYQKVAAILSTRPRGGTVPANKTPKGMIGRQWLSRFRDRHTELASRFAGRIDNQRVVVGQTAGICEGPGRVR